VDPLVSVITSLGLDHKEVLGSTFEDIAREKGALLGENLVISSGALTPTFVAICASRGTQIHVARQDHGDYQASNTFTALKAVEFLTKRKIIRRPFNFEDLYTVTPSGRFEEIKKEVFLDVAHNPEGIRALQKKNRVLFSKKGDPCFGGIQRQRPYHPF
jgi:dihydrofolate synthase/folylpolyglutamate synthase